MRPLERLREHHLLSPESADVTYAENARRPLGGTMRNVIRNNPYTTAWISLMAIAIMIVEVIR